MITKSKFGKLDIDSKGEYVFQEGSYIGVRSYYNHLINLHSLYDFFVEVWYSPGKNEIQEIEAVQSEKTLDLYINEMNMPNKP